MSCPYKHILGIPGQGVHAARFLGLSINDILMTIAAAALTSLIFKLPFWPTLLIWLIVGEVLHYLFGVQTALLDYIGLRVQCDTSRVGVAPTLLSNHTYP